MDAITCIKTRKSSRKYLPREVDRLILREVISDALKAPSYRNTQPWEVTVVSGKRREQLSSLLIQLLESGVKAQPDMPEPAPWPEYIQARITDTQAKRNHAFGAGNKDPNAAMKSVQNNFGFYGAPAALFFYHDASLGMWSILDIGMFIENVILGFHARGLATVPQAFLVNYSAEVKDFLHIPSHKRLVIGMSVGYADVDDVKSSFESDRAPVDEILHWSE